MLQDLQLRERFCEDSIRLEAETALLDEVSLHRLHRNDRSDGHHHELIVESSLVLDRRWYLTLVAVQHLLLLGLLAERGR